MHQEKSLLAAITCGRKGLEINTRSGRGLRGFREDELEAEEGIMEVQGM